MNGHVVGLVLAVLVPVCLPVSAAGKAAPASGPQRVVVLDTSGLWWMHNQLKPPVIQYDDGPRPVPFHETWVDAATEGTPRGWMEADFDDGNCGPAVCPNALPRLPVPPREAPGVGAQGVGHRPSCGSRTVEAAAAQGVALPRRLQGEGESARPVLAHPR